MATLLSLPLELLVYTSSFVSTSDLASLRLTCKQTEKSLYEWFSEEFFMKKQFMLTQPSLQVLLDISRHVSFSKKLKHLIIATNVYDDIPLRFKDGDACSRYMQGYADQQALLNNGIDREMLTEAFRGLENLETVDVRDFSARRERDGTYWNSWGATTAYQETGFRLQTSYRGTGSQTRFVSHVFTNLMYALGTAGRTPPRFEVLLRQQPAGLPDSAFHLANFMYPAVKPVLQNLKALFLTLNLSDMSNRTHNTYNGGIPVGSVANRPLCHFLSCTPNLTHLRLNFQKFHVSDNRAFMQWLAVPPASTPDAQEGGPTQMSFSEPTPVNLPHLTALDLGQLDISKDILLSVISKFAAKLERLSLWRITIDAGPPVLYDPKPNFWSRFLKELAAMPQLEMTYLKMGALTQNKCAVAFKSEVGGNSQSETAREYSGREMKRFISTLAQDVTVDLPPDLYRDSDAGASSSDQEMDDEEAEGDDSIHDDDEDDDDE